MPDSKPKTILCIGLLAGACSASALGQVTFGSALVNFHGSASASGFRSYNYNYLVEADRSPRLGLAELILNGSAKWSNGVSMSAQLYAYKVDHYNATELDFANITYSRNKYIGFRAGRIKMPFGLYGETQDVDMLRPYALLPIDAYARMFRTLGGGYDGVGVFGQVPGFRWGSLQYKLGGGFMKKSDVSGSYFKDLTQASPIEITDMEPGKVLSAALDWETPVESLRAVFTTACYEDFNYSGHMRSFSEVGHRPSDLPNGPGQFDPAVWDKQVAGQYGHTSSDIIRSSAALEYKQDHWSVAAEYYRMWLSSVSVDPEPIGIRKVSQAADGFVLYGIYEPSKYLQFGTYYGEAYANVHDRNGTTLVGVPKETAFLKDLALSAAFSPFRWWQIKAEVHFLRGAKGLSFRVNGDAAQWGGDWRLFVLKSTVSF